MLKLPTIIENDQTSGYTLPMLVPLAHSGMVPNGFYGSFQAFKHILNIFVIFEFWHTRVRDQNPTQFWFKILQKSKRKTVHGKKKVAFFFQKMRKIISGGLAKTIYFIFWVSLDFLESFF